MPAENHTTLPDELESASRRPAVLLGLIMLAGLGLRLYGIANRGFWWDEVALWREALTFELHTHAAVLPGIFTAILMRLTNDYTPFAAHVPPVIFGTLAIGAAYMLARELVDVRTGLVAALLTAISPMTIYYSQEARPYALLQLLATLLIHSFIRAAGGTSIRRWAVFTVLAVLCGHTHLVAVHLLAGLTLAFAITATIDSVAHRFVDSRKVLYLLASLTISFGLGYTWPLFRDAITEVLEGSSAPGVLTFVRATVGALAAGLPIRLTSSGWLVLTALPGMILAVAGAKALVRKKRMAALTLLCCLLVSLVTLYFTLGVKAAWPWLRYMSHIWIPMLILIAAGWRHFPASDRRIVRALVLLVVLACFTPGLAWWAGQATDLRSEEYRDRAATVHAQQITLTGIIYPTHKIRYGDETFRNIDLYRLHREDSLPEYIVGEGIHRLTLVPAAGTEIPVRGAPIYRLPKGRYAVVSRGGLTFITLHRDYPLTVEELVDQELVIF